MSANAEARSQGLSQKAKRQRATAIIMADTMMHKNLIFLSIIACFRKNLCNFAIKFEPIKHFMKVMKICVGAIATIFMAICSSNRSYAVCHACNNVCKDYIAVADTMPTQESKAKELDEKQKKWIYKHIKYPKAALESNIQGMVTVWFEVETDGSIDNVKVVRSAHPLLNDEAVRVVKSMPKFKPVIENGMPVKQQFTMIVPFKLN